MDKKHLVLPRYIAAHKHQAPAQHDRHLATAAASALASSTDPLAATAPSSTRKRKRGGERLNDAQRLEIIRQRRLPDAPSLRKLAGAFNVSERSIRNVMLAAAAIEQRAACADLKDQLRTFRSATPRFPELEERVFQWLQALRGRPTPSATIAKAKAIAAELGIPATAFKASPGWLERFRKRRHLVDARLSVGGRDVSSIGRNLNGAGVVASAASRDPAQVNVAEAQNLQSGAAVPVSIADAPPTQVAGAEDPSSVGALLLQLAAFEGGLRALQDAHSAECGRLQQCLANASVIRHDLLAVHAAMRVRSLRAGVDLDAIVDGVQLPAPSGV